MQQLTTTTHTRRRFSKVERMAVGLRDAWLCLYCRADLLGERWHPDHVVALSRGGSDDLSNIVTSCPHCNLSKGAKPLQIWCPAAVEAALAALARPVDVEAARRALEVKRGRD